MAVNMNKREHPAALCTITLVLFCVCFGLASSATTPASSSNTTSPPASTPPAAASDSTLGQSVSSDPNATTITTTVSTTTTTTTTTATTPASSTGSTISVVGQCPCDVTGNACDVNCWCDEECSDADRQAFTQRLFSQQEEDPLCFPEELFLFENSDTVRSETQDGQLCIYSDNSGNSDTYTQPDLVDSLSVFHDYQEEFSSFSFHTPALSAALPNTSFYKSGDPIYTVMESEAVGQLGLPSPLTSMDCLDSNPAAYLLDQTFSCVRNIRDLSSDCESAPALDARRFFTGFRVVTRPELFQMFNSTLTDTEGFSLYNSGSTVEVKLDNRTVDPIQCLDPGSGNITTCSGPSLPGPSLQAAVCANILSQVHYTIITDGSAGIVDVLARFVLTPVTLTSGGSVSFMQTFSTTFESVSSGDIVERSGNPGYVVGQPLLAGTLIQTTDPTGTTTDRIEVNPDRGRYMTVVRSSANGDCVTGFEGRSSVLFGQDVRTGCLLRVSADNLTDYCRQTQESIVRVLELDSPPEATDTGYRDNNRYVGLYGNSGGTGDWVKILYQNRPSPLPPLPQTSICRLSLGMHIQVMYADIGALVNPQPKVIAAAFIYDDPTDVQVTLAASGQVTQAVPISTAVSFLDVSKEAATYEAHPSIYGPKVPDDFFYPFVTGTASCWPHPWTWLTASHLVVVALTWGW